MFVTIRRYGVDPIDAPEIVRRVREGFIPIVKEVEGFVAYQIVDSGGGFITTISTSQSLEAAKQSGEVSKEWTGENLVGLLSGIPDTTTGEVVVDSSSASALHEKFGPNRQRVI